MTSREGEGDVYTIIGDKYTRFPSDGERSFDEINYSGRLTADYQLSDQDLFSLGLYAEKELKNELLIFSIITIVPPPVKLTPNFNITMQT